MMCALLVAGLADCERSMPSSGTSNVTRENPASPPAAQASLEPEAKQRPTAAERTSHSLQPASPSASIRYPSGLVHSPLTPGVVAKLKAIRRSAQRQANRFIKVGDSITSNPLYMGCFTNGEPRNDAEHSFIEDLVAYFGPAGGHASHDPFTRESLAARAGVDAEWVVTGGPKSPLVQEIDAMNPAYALMMFGTNTVSRGGSTDGKLDGVKLVYHFKYHWQALNLLLERGVIPILMTAPPNRTTPRSEYIIGELNRVVRALAEYHQVPLVDFHHAASAAPHFGLWRASDGNLDVHPSACGNGCDFSASGLECGVNIRNLLSMQALARLKRVLDDGQPAPDALTAESTPRLSGSGTKSTPYQIQSLPFIDLRRFDSAHRSALSDYGGCKREAAQAFNPVKKQGPEVVYQLKLQQEKRLSIALLTAEAEGLGEDASPAHRQLFLLKGEPNGEHCLAFRHTLLQNTFSPGTYYLVVDSEASAQSGAKSATQLASETPFALLISECPADDPACDPHDFISVGPPATNDPAANW